MESSASSPPLPAPAEVIAQLGQAPDARGGDHRSVRRLWYILTTTSFAAAGGGVAASCCGPSEVTIPTTSLIGLAPTALGLISLTPVTSVSPCCAVEEQATGCEPEAKADCCGIAR